MAKKPKRKMSQLESEYSKQRKRIQNFMRRAEKRGYVFEENALPAKPKKITKASVNRLSKLTAQELYKKAFYVDENSGEAFDARYGLQKAKREGQIKRQRTLARKLYEKYKDKPQIEPPSYNGIDDYDDITDYVRHPDEIDNIPTVDKWMEIRHRLISEFPDKFFVHRGRGVAYFVDGQPYENELLSIWQDTYERYDYDLYELNKYVDEHEEKFSEAITVVRHASDQEGLEAAVSELARWLNAGGALTSTQLEGLNDITYGL